jgi:TRAP-type mannitol/chloroaromatic compound transport system permease large subunit
MYEGAFVPGLVLALLYTTYVFLVTLIFPNSAPGLPAEAIRYRESDGARGVWQLGILSLFSGLVGYYILKQTETRAGADFVILTISTGVLVALICAVMNRFLGARRVASQPFDGLFVGASSGSRRRLFDSRHSGGAGRGRGVYALVVGLVERFSGVPLISRMPAGHLRHGATAALIFARARSIVVGVGHPDGGRGDGRARVAGACRHSRRRLDNTQPVSTVDVRQATESTARLSAFVLFI